MYVGLRHIRIDLTFQILYSFDKKDDFDPAYVETRSHLFIFNSFFCYNKYLVLERAWTGFNDCL